MVTMTRASVDVAGRGKGGGTLGCRACEGGSQLGRAFRSSAALTLCALIGFRPGLSPLAFSSGTFSAFIAIMCVEATVGATVRMSFDVLLGGFVALLLFAPWLALPPALRTREFVVAPVLCANCFICGAATMPLATRRVAMALSALQLIAPLSSSKALEPLYGLELLGVLALGAGSAVATLLLVPPRPFARAQLARQLAHADAQAAEAFGCLVKAYCEQAPANCPASPASHAWLVRAAFLLQELAALPEAAAQLRADAAWEWQWGGRCSGRPARDQTVGPRPGALSTRRQQRQLRRMERGLHAHADMLADDPRHVGAVHAAFQRHLSQPLRDLAALVAAAAERKVAKAEAVTTAVGSLRAAFQSARLSLLYAEEQAAGSAETTGADELVRAYVDGYSRGLNSLLLSAMLFSLPLLAVEQPRPAAEPAAGGAAGEAEKGEGSADMPPVPVWRTALARARCVLVGQHPRTWVMRRGTQSAIAVLLAALAPLLPASRAALGPATLYAPLEATLLLMDRTGSSAQQSLNRLLGTVAGAAAGYLISLGVDTLPRDAARQRDAVALCALAAWALLACTLRSSRTHGYAAVVASWTAPVIVSPQLGLGSVQAHAIDRCAMALVGAGACVLAASMIAPQWAQAQAPLEAAAGVAHGVALLAQEASSWCALLRTPHGYSGGALPAEQSARANGADADDAAAKAAAASAASSAAQAAAAAAAEAAEAAAAEAEDGAQEALNNRQVALEKVDSKGGGGAAPTGGALLDTLPLLPVLTPSEGRDARDACSGAGRSAEALRLPTLVVDHVQEAMRVRHSGMRLAKARAHWEAADRLHAEAQAEAALCGSGARHAATFGAVSERGRLFVVSLESVHDAVEAIASPAARALLGSEPHLWAGADFVGAVAGVAAAAAVLGARCATALQLAAAEARVNARMCHSLDTISAARVGDAAVNVRSARASLRAHRAALARQNMQTITEVVASGRAEPWRRLSLTDSLLHYTATDSLMRAADELLELAIDVERACERSAVQAGNEAYGLSSAVAGGAVLGLLRQASAQAAGALAGAGAGRSTSLPAVVAVA